MIVACVEWRAPVIDCLDANAVQDLMSDALEASAKRAVMTHLDTCADCRELVGVLAKDTIRESQPGAAPTGLEATALPAAPGLGATALAETQLGTRDPLAETADGTDRFRKPSGIGVGRQLGKYTLVERLGAGAMGIVYRAEDRELARHVAVKVLHRPDDALTERLVREARSMAQVNHPNVVAVYDVGNSDATTYIAMELVEGTSLRTWQQTPRTIAEVIEAYVAAGRGLAAAHAAGIVHRDFKPDNVLVGAGGRVRVTDFGLAAARPIEGDQNEPASRLSATITSDLSLTRSGSVLGTPAYMAPEQFEGGHVDARTDQFNFCVALYEALYKERPFEGKSYEELGESVVTGRVKPAPANTRVSKALRSIVLRGMAVRPGDRYPTMDHLLDELVRDRAKPWRRAAYASAALALVLGVGFTVDWIIHARLADKTTRAFAAIGAQTDRTVGLIVKLNEAISGQVHLFGAMTAVNAFREEAEFGLGSEETDAQALQDLRDSLVAADWQLARNITPTDRPSHIAVADYKGRLLFTSAANAWKTDLTRLPWMREAMQTGKSNSMQLVRYDDPDMLATQLLGNAPRDGMAIVFTRTGPGGNSFFFQLLDADDILAHIDLDNETLLSMVAAEGHFRGNVPRELIAQTDGRIHEVDLGNATYQVLAKPIIGPDKRTAGHIVMASRVDGVLSLFPHARLVFAIAMIVASAIAIAMALRARSLRA